MVAVNQAGQGGDLLSIGQYLAPKDSCSGFSSLAWVASVRPSAEVVVPSYRDSDMLCDDLRKPHLALVPSGMQGVARSASKPPVILTKA